MSFCLPLAYWQESVKKKTQREENEPLLGDSVSEMPSISQASGGLNHKLWMWTQAPAKKNERLENLMLAIPTFFDLVATILMNVGLLYVTASVYQVFDCSLFEFCHISCHFC